MKKVLKCILIVLCVVVGLAVAGATTFYFRALHYVNDTARKNDVVAFEKESYDCLYVTMYSEQEASGYPFEYYMGMKTYITEHCYDNLRDYTDYVGEVLSGENGVSTVYSLFEPVLVNNAFFNSATLTQKSYRSTLLEIITTNSDVNFIFLLPGYSLEHWEELSANETKEIRDSYLLFCNEFQDLQNVKIFYFGNMEWLVGNSLNYVEEYYTEDILERLVTLTLAGEEYRVSGEKMSIWLEETRELAEAQKAKTEYDLSEYEIVFFGDSIVGNYSGSSSIPGVVNALSGAETYNCAIGGQAASEVPGSESVGFGRTVSLFLGENAEKFTDKVHFYEEVERFHDAEHSEKKLCFVINYGINDYYDGRKIIGTAEDIYSYKGALQSGIQRLQQAYPEAEFVLMTPNFVQLFEFGKLILSEEGDVLEAYVNAGISLAEELGISCVDNYTKLGINENNFRQYLEDGTHLNETGRFEYARILVEYLIKK